MKRKLSNNLTFQEAISLFIKYEEIKGLSPQTIGMDKEAINKFLKTTNLSGDDKVSIVSEGFFNDFLAKLKDEGISLSTKNICLSHLRVFLYWCIKEGHIEPFKINLFKGQESKIKFFTDDEIQKLLIKPSKDCQFFEDRTYTLICFIMSTGARANTVLNLRIEDLDFKSKTITFTHLKNKGTAIIPMSNSLAKVLKDFLDTWDRKLEGYVFCNGSEGKLTLTALESSLRKYCVNRGVKPRGPHSLRHSFARLYIKNGGDAFSLQQILTHSTMNMTQKYVRLFADDLRKPIENFSPLDNFKGNNYQVINRRVN